jgi:hypothetical protein
MRKLLILCAAILCVSNVLVAQDQPGNSPTTAVSLAAPAPAAPPSSPRRMSSSIETRWQLGVGYQYFRLRAGPLSKGLNGFSTSITYYKNNWLGIEGNIVGTFGSLTPTFKEKYAFYGGGIHLGARNLEKFQPWAHVLFGGTHLSVTQTVGPSSFNGYGVVTGGGVDLMFKPGLGVRVSGDFVSSHLSGAWQKNFQFGAGLVLNF